MWSLDWTESKGPSCTLVVGVCVRKPAVSAGLYKVLCSSCTCPLLVWFEVKGREPRTLAVKGCLHPQNFSYMSTYLSSLPRSCPGNIYGVGLSTFYSISPLMGLDAPVLQPLSGKESLFSPNTGLLPLDHVCVFLCSPTGNVE